MVAIFCFFIVFYSVGCFAVDLDEATKAFIKCMLDNQDATYGISTGQLRAVPRGEHIINGWFDGHMKHTYLMH